MQTLKGTKIARFHDNVGKRVGNNIYVHWMYADEVIPHDIACHMYRVLADNGINLSDYNCFKYNCKTNEIAVQEAPDFDTASEPMVGKWVLVKPDSHRIKTGFSPSVWHHKWCWVKDDYEGFNVQEAKEWSEYWLARLPETAEGSSLEAWHRQLERNGVARIYGTATKQ